jgi:glycosyltransferase involved in cell wall biosynthesis
MQDCPPAQFVLVDNCSTDRTVELVRSYEDHFRERGIAINIIVEKDKGIYDALNKGLHVATGKWINIVGGDDCYLPGAMCKVMTATKDASFDILHANIEVADSEGKSYQAKPRLDVESVSRGMFLFHPAMFASRESYQKVGDYGNFRLSGDYDWVYRAVRLKSRFHYLDTSLVRHFAAGLSTQKRAMGLAENDTIRRQMNVAMPLRMAHYLREKYLSPGKRWLVEALNK